MRDLSTVATGACLPPGMADHKPQFKKISVDMIAPSPDRRRPTDPKSVDMLVKSIRQHGVLQPIGVQINPARRADPPAPDSARYLPVWGVHRAAAVRFLVETARRDGDEDSACRYAEIPALVFDEDAPAEFMRRFEIVENLHRKELSPAQRRAQTAELAVLVAKDLLPGKVEYSKGGGSGKRGPAKGLVASISDESGIHPNVVKDRLDSAAKEAGETIDYKNPDPEQLQRIADKASESADAESAAKSAAGVRKSIKLKPGDPAPLISWVNARNKEGVMTVENVIAYRDALSAWIEAKRQAD